MDSSCAPLVNAKLLHQFIGRQVTVIGEVGAGATPTLTTGDGGIIGVQLPPGEYFEGRFSQVIGKVVTGNTISAIKVTPVSEDFNMGNYESLVQLAHGAYRNLFLP